MFVFDNTKLKPFDVLLVRFIGDETSEKIREKCNSDFSHTVVYIGDDSFIEGTYPVVSLFSSQRYYFNNLDDVKVLRLTEDQYRKFDVAKAEDFIRSIAYCDYNTRLLVSILNRDLPNEVIDRFHNDKVWTGGVVCTSLVTLPFYIGGVDISSNNEPYFAHFGYIENSPFFTDVTKDVFRKVKNQLPDNTYDYLAGAQTGSLLETQSNMVKELNNMVASIMLDIKNNIDQYAEYNVHNGDLLFTTWEDVLPLIGKLFLSEKGKEIDKKIFDKIVSLGYNRLWYEEVHSHQRLFFPFYYLMTDRNKGIAVEARKHYEFSTKILVKSRERMQKNEEIVFDNFNLCPSRSNHVLLDMYHCWGDLLDSTIRQYEAICERYEELTR